MCWYPLPAVLQEKSSVHHHLHASSHKSPCWLVSGEGVSTDLAIAHDLYKRAAELGDPDAQADMAVRLALGLRPTTGPGSRQYGLTSPDVPAALLNYFFAAAGNDSFAQMALGYRHMYGVDVPQNCQAGLLYYHPVAEQVIEAARYPGQLPQVAIKMYMSACHMQHIINAVPCKVLPQLLQLSHTKSCRRCALTLAASFMVACGACGLDTMYSLLVNCIMVCCLLRCWDLQRSC